MHFPATVTDTTVSTVMSPIYSMLAQCEDFARCRWQRSVPSLSLFKRRDIRDSYRDGGSCFLTYSCVMPLLKDDATRVVKPHEEFQHAYST